jgi:putative transposase
VNAQFLQQALHRVDLAFKAFFRRAKSGEKPGYPRFKSRDRYQSLCWPQDIGFHVVGKKHLRLSGLGELRIKLHRPLEGKPKTCTVRCEAGVWYASFSSDGVESRRVLHPAPDREIGIDLGLDSFATLSTGEKIENPRWYRVTQERLAEAARNLNRKKRGSKNRATAKACLAKLHAKVANQRRDFEHKLALRIVSEHRLMAVEDLSPREIVRNSTPGIRKSVHDAAWAQFLKILSCKAEEAGRTLVKVSARGTSSTCSGCGVYRKKELSEREHRCPCGLVLDRDHNASLNILRRGTRLQASA